MNAADLQDRIKAQAIALVVDVHRAKLPELSKMVAEKIAKDEGASRVDILGAVARGTVTLLACVLLTSCRPAAAAVATPSDSATVYTLAADTRLPGARFMGYARPGVEVWEHGDVTVLVRRAR